MLGGWRLLRSDEAIPFIRNNKTYTGQYTGGKGALIKELHSWVKLADLSLVSGDGSISNSSIVKVRQTDTVTKLYETSSSTKNI